jgi:hypothetical protein
MDYVNLAEILVFYDEKNMLKKVTAFCSLA